MLFIFTIIVRDSIWSAIVVAILILISLVVYTVTQVLDWYISLLGFASIFSFLYIWTKFLNARAKKAAATDKKLLQISGRYVRLLVKECHMMDAFAPILFTVFDATSSGDANLANTLDWIRRRVKVITEKNPFLLGRLRTDPATSLPAIWVPCLEKSKDFIDKTFEKFFTEVTVDDDVEGFRKDNLPYKQASVGCGETVLDEPDQAIAKITVIKSAKSNKFAIMFSMCHVVGDGYSLYNLYSLLDPERYPNHEKIPTFSVERDHRFDSKITFLQHEYGQQQHLIKFAFCLKEYLLDTASRTLVPSFLGLKTTVQKFREKTTQKWFKIRKDWIEQEKKKYQQLADSIAKEYFENKSNGPSNELSQEEENQLVNIKISTNDVLSAFIYENMFVHRRHAMCGCAYELRNRYFPCETPITNNKRDDTSDARLGNYFEILLFTRGEALDPLKIRRLVNSKGRTAEIDSAAYNKIDIIPPTSAQCSRSVPIITNWATFYKTLAFPGYKVSLHAPLEAFGDPNVVTREPLAVIFVYNGDGDLAVLNCCDRQPLYPTEAPFEGELEF